MPDIAPYAEATQNLRTAVDESGKSSELSLKLLEATEPAFRDNEEFRRSVDSLRDAWRLRVATLDAVVAYVDALQELVDAGTTGSQAVDKVADHLMTLANAIGVTPASAATSATADGAKFVYGQIASIRASRSLLEALPQSNSVVTRLTQVLREDFRELEGILAVIYEAQRAALTDAHNIELGYRKGLVNARKALYAEPNLTNDQLAHLRSINEQLEGTLDWYLPFQESRARIDANQIAAHQLITATDEGLNQWALAHERLVKAAQEQRDRPPHIERLSSVVVEMKEITKRIKEL